MRPPFLARSPALLPLWQVSAGFLSFGDLLRPFEWVNLSFVYNRYAALIDLLVFTLIFVHDVNRQSIGMTRVLSGYAVSRADDGLHTGLVFLADDETQIENMV